MFCCGDCKFGRRSEVRLLQELLADDQSELSINPAMLQLVAEPECRCGKRGDAESLVRLSDLVRRASELSDQSAMIRRALTSEWLMEFVVEATILRQCSIR